MAWTYTKTIRISFRDAGAGLGAKGSEDYLNMVIKEITENNYGIKVEIIKELERKGERMSKRDWIIGANPEQIVLVEKQDAYKEGQWQCKKHGKDCKSYVSGFVEELNLVEIKPEDTKEFDAETKKMLELVEWVD